VWGCATGYRNRAEAVELASQFLPVFPVKELLGRPSLFE